ncbi:MAG: hypothetical protein PWP69_2163 [Enterococcus sp.]|nr:hypothetical protein [Enterococcus sp.]
MTVNHDVVGSSPTAGVHLTNSVKWVSLFSFTEVMIE